MLANLWRGEVGLGRAYWVGGWVVGGLLAAATGVAQASGAGVLHLALVAALLAYQPIILVGIWRSAGRYTGPAKWARAARLLVILGAVIWLVVLAAFVLA